MWRLDRTEEKIFIEEIYPCTGTADKLQGIVSEGQNQVTGSENEEVQLDSRDLQGKITKGMTAYMRKERHKPLGFFLLKCSICDLSRDKNHQVTVFKNAMISRFSGGSFLFKGKIYSEMSMK